MSLTLSKEQLDAQLDLIKSTTGLNPVSPFVISEYFLKVVQFLDERAKLSEDFVAETNSSAFIQDSISQVLGIKQEVTNEKNEVSAIAGQVTLTNLEVQAAKDATLLAQANANLAQNPLGEYNAATNVPTLAALPPAAPAVPIGSFYNITEDGNISFAGSNFTSGAAVKIGGRIIKKSESLWYYQKPSSLSLESLNGVKVDSFGKATGLILPESQYLHSRGLSELTGNTTYFSAASYGLYELMSSAVLFNTIRIPFNMITAGDVTVRVYKSTTLQTNPNAMTLLAEKIFLSGNFNTLSNTLQEVTLDDFVRAKEGEYIYVYAQTNAINKLQVKRWDVQAGAAPLRHGFYYSTNTATPWNVVYELSSGTFLAATFQLLCINTGATTKAVNDKVNQDLVGIKIDPFSGRAYGIYTPIVSYEHPRGESEILGNGIFSSASDFGFGFYDSVSQYTTFNKIEVSVKALSAQPVTVKVYKHSAASLVIASYTLLETLDFAAGSFNSTSTKAVITLSSHYHLNAGEYIYVLFYCGVGNVLQTARFTADAASPSRHGFLRKTTAANPWTTNWELSFTASGYYQSGIRLYNLENDPEQLARIKAAEDRITANTDALLLTVAKESNGKIPAAYIPTVTFTHARGESEMIGNTAFNFSSTSSVALFEQMSVDTVFNKIEFPMYFQKTIGNVTIKLLTGDFSSSFNTLTELASQTFQAIDMNKSSGAFQKMILDTPVKVPAGKYVYIAMTCDTLGAIATRYWNIDASSPARKRILYTTVLAPWSSTWTISSGTYYAPAFRLSLADYSVENRILALETAKSLKLVFPSKIYACVGVELSIYYDQIINVKDNGLASNAEYLVEIVCSKGLKKDRYWRITPAAGDVGTHQLVVYIYDSQNNLVSSKICSLIIIAASGAATQKCLIQVGDSITNNDNSRIAINERKAALSGGIPFTLVGTVGGGSTRHEGHSGWQFSDFIGSGATSPAPVGNPFWNTTTGLLDITNYRTVTLGMSTYFDVVSIQLGVNDCRKAKLSETQLYQSIINAKVLISAFLSDSPSAKILIQIPTTDMNVMWSETYYQKGNYKYNIWRLREMIIESFDNFSYHANVYVGQAGLGLDRYYGYPIANIPVAARYTETEIVHSDDVHPRTEGYKQMGDTIFPQILAMLQ